MKEKSNTSCGVGMIELLQVVFIVLKLCKIIDWSWWWVLAPTLGAFALLVAIAIIRIIVVMISEWAVYLKRKS